jgi:filamentous hemagglutinin family protein
VGGFGRLEEGVSVLEAVVMIGDRGHSQAVDLCLSRCSMNLSLTRLIFLGLLLYPTEAWAQIRADGTQSTRVTSPDGQHFTVDGGDRAGSSLFHSFQELSVPTGGSVWFNNSPDVATIFSRVTGTSLSTINGLIRANGQANLFLLNPNGIIFGPNAQLDIGGSWIASTANSLRFADGTVFSAVAPNPVLTVSVSVGLQYGDRPGAIISQGNLQVAPGQTLGLLGGGLSVNSGSLKAPAGQVELAAVRSGTVNLTGFEFNYDSPTRGQIELSNGAIVNTDGTGGGRIHLTGQDISLVGGANLQSNTLGNGVGQDIRIDAQRLAIGKFSFIASNSLAEGSAGDILINARQAADLTGTGGFDLQSQLSSLLQTRRTLDGSLPRGSLLSFAAGSGAGGDIRIQTRHLNLRRGAAIFTSPFATGQGGDLVINADGNVILSESGLISSAVGDGSAGELRVNADRLVLRDGTVLSSGTLGRGGGGDMRFQTNDMVVTGGLAGFLGQTITSSTIAAGSIGGTAPGGDITIATQRLRVSGGGIISSGSGLFADEGRLQILQGGRGGDITVRATESVEVLGRSPDLRFPSVVEARTVSRARAGDISITTPRLVVRNGALVTSDTSSSGKGGDLRIQADLIDLTGSAEGQFRSGLFSSSGVPGRDLVGSGSAGSIILTTERLQLDRHAQVGVNSLGTADAGAVRIRANQIAIDNGRINATTASGEGGNIRLRAADQLFISNQGQIVATAGGTGNGGNVTIAAPFVIANNNGDIVANAVRGTGGNIQITTEGIFGTDYRSQLTPDSDITASSQFGLSGQVNIIRPNVAPDSGLIELPDTVRDSSQQIAASCNAATSRFIVTGQGGLPENPVMLQYGDRPWDDLRDLTPHSHPSERTQTRPASPEPLLEATTWTTDAQSKITLIAAATRNFNPAATCATHPTP